MGKVAIRMAELNKEAKYDNALGVRFLRIYLLLGRDQDFSCLLI
jgi:hypothetical protein